MEHAYIHLLHQLAGHSAWMLAVVFLGAFLEAIRPTVELERVRHRRNARF